METNIVTIVGGIITAIIGWIAGSLWEVYKAKKTRVGEHALQSTIIPNIYHNGKSNIVNVIIQMQNVGSGVAFIKCPDSKGHENPILEVMIVPNTLKGSVILWENLSPLFPPIEFLKEFYSSPDKYYIVEPGNTLKEQVYFITDYDGILILRNTLWDIEGYRIWSEQLVDLRKATSPDTA